MAIVSDKNCRKFPADLMEAAIDARSEVREAALVLVPPRTSLNIASERAGVDKLRRGS